MFIGLPFLVFSFKMSETLGLNVNNLLVEINFTNPESSNLIMLISFQS